MPVVYTYDWHKERHPSFKEQGGPWPSHCVQGTVGAMIDSRVFSARTDIRIGKGAEEECYSGFTPDLHRILVNLDKRRLFVCGLALDYCVKHTALDAARSGFETVVVKDATRSVYPDKQGDVLDELLSNGVVIAPSTWVLSSTRAATPTS